MKLKNLIFAVTAAICTASCNEYNALFSEDESNLSSTLNEFTENFETRYGKIDPNHDWGFKDLTPGSSVSTRSTIVNRNEWEQIQTTYHCQYPGWPFEEQEGETKYSGKYNGANSSGNYEGAQDTKNVLPAGDVTDEEIQYVSWWFRTHPNPGRIELHLTDFFIQEISSDCDRDAEGNAIKTADILELQNGEWVKTGTESNITYHQDYIGALASNQNVENCDHTNNFNYQHSNWLGGNDQLNMGSNQPSYDNTTYSQRLCQFFTSSGTEDFSCRSTDDNTTHDNWNLQHLVFDVNGRHYDGYYLGFNYQLYKQDSEDKKTVHPADDYYSNWIVKISPAEPVTDETLSARVLCEDLGNTYDFDFNDVVFDVTYQSATDALITLRASGGTLPIYVGDMEHEAHNMLGCSNTKQPINVGKGPAEYDMGRVANYHITVNSTNPRDIPIYVIQNSNTATFTNISMPKGENKTPQALAVPVGVRWPKESKQIHDPYPEFPNWVTNREYLKNGKAWFHNDNINTSKVDMLWDKSGSGYTGDATNVDNNKENGGKEEQQQTPYFTTTAVTLDKAINDEFNLEAYMTEYLDDKWAIKVTRSDETVLDYNGQGTFKALKEGTCVITLTYQGQSIAITVNVKSYGTKVTLSESNEISLEQLRAISTTGPITVTVIGHVNQWAAGNIRLLYNKKQDWDAYQLSYFDEDLYKEASQTQVAGGETVIISITLSADIYQKLLSSDGCKDGLFVSLSNFTNYEIFVK